MNSTYSVSDAGAFSPVDFGSPVVTTVTRGPAEGGRAATASRRKSAGRGGAAAAPVEEEFKILIQPTLLGRRVDPSTRRIFPTVERLPVESHTITLTSTLVTKELLAKEEESKRRRPQREESRQAEEEGGTVATAARNHPSQRILAPAAGGGVDKAARRGGGKGATSSGGLLANGALAAATKKLQHARSGETALVRLSNGKVVRVPMHILRQHQAAVKAASGSGTGANGGVANGPAAAAAAQQTRLSQLLSRISQQQQPPPATASAASSASTTAPSAANVVVNGRLPPLPAQLANVQPGHRLVKIRAHPGAPVGVPGQAISAQSSQAKLSDRLGTLISNTAVLVNAPGGPNGPLRTYQGPNSSTAATLSPHLVLRQGTNPAGSPQGQSQSVERVIVMGPRGTQVPKLQLPQGKGSPSPSVAQLRRGAATVAAPQALPAGATRAIVVHQVPVAGQQPQGQQQQVIRTLITQGGTPPRVVASGVTPQQQQKLVTLMTSPSRQAGAGATTAATLLTPQKIVVPSSPMASAISQSAPQSPRLVSLSPQKVLVGPGGDIRLVLPQPQSPGNQPKQVRVVSSAPPTPATSPPKKP